MCKPAIHRRPLPEMNLLVDIAVAAWALYGVYVVIRWVARGP